MARSVSNVSESRLPLSCATCPTAAGDLTDQLAARVAELNPVVRGGTTPSLRELEVLSLVAEGKTDREIAADLFISHHTVMSHVSNILNKLGVESPSAAVALAVRRNLV